MHATVKLIEKAEASEEQVKVALSLFQMVGEGIGEICTDFENSNEQGLEIEVE